MNRTQLTQALAALETEQQGILSKLASGEATPELTERDKTLTEQIADHRSKLAVMTEAQQRLAAFKPTSPAANDNGRVSVHDNREDKPFTSSGEVLDAVARAELAGRRDIDPLLHNLAIGQSNAIDSEGGFLVGTDIANEIWRYVYGPSNISTQCRALPVGVNSNAFEVPVLEETSRATGSRNGGARAFWTGEAGTINNSSIKVGKVRIELEKLAALMYATNENLADATQMSTLLTGFAGEELAWTLDDAIIAGDGAGKPLGILNSPALVTQAAEGGQAAGTVNFANVSKMWGRILPQAKQRGSWYIHSSVFPQLVTMASAATSANQLVYMPPGGVSAAPFGTLFGRPVIEIEQAPALGSVGDIMFADLQAYGLARKGGVNVDSSIHVRFLTDETAFRITMRVNGRPLPKAAITDAKGSSARSAFVALAAR